MGIITPSATALAMLAYFKAYQRISSTDTTLDDTINLHINAVSDAFAAYCRREQFGFGLQLVNEQFSAEGRQELVLTHAPIIGTPTIYIGTNDDGTAGFQYTTDNWQVENTRESILFCRSGWPDTRLATGDVVFNAPRLSPYGGSVYGDSIQEYNPSPYAVRRAILVQYTAGWILPPYYQSGTLTNGAATVSGLLDTTNLSAGMFVYGAGVPAGATIASITDATDLVLSANATATGAATLTFVAGTTMTGTTTIGSATVTGLSDARLWAVGTKVTGTGIPAGTTIIAPVVWSQTANSSTITLSQAATASGTVTLTFAPDITGAKPLPASLMQAVCTEVDRVIGLTGARGLKSQNDTTGYRAMFYAEADIDATAARVLNLYRRHFTG